MSLRISQAGLVRFLNVVSVALVLILAAVVTNAYSTRLESEAVATSTSEQVKIDLNLARRRMKDKIILLGKPEPAEISLASAIDSAGGHQSLLPAIIDVRPRELYAASHIMGAFNIPMDEFQVRAKLEIPDDRPIVIFCGISATCIRKASVRGEATACMLAARQVQIDTSHTNVNYLAVPIDEVPDVLLASSPPLNIVREWLAQDQVSRPWVEPKQ